MFEKFLKRNLASAERESSREDQDDMAGLVAQGSHVMRELGDQLSGERDLKKHAHHKASDLADAVIDSISAVVKLRKEIESKKK